MKISQKFRPLAPLDSCSYMFKSDFYAYASNTVKPVLNIHTKIDKTKVLMTNGSLMKVESIAECTLGAFCNTLDLH